MTFEPTSPLSSAFNFASIALILSSFDTSDELDELAMLRPLRDSFDAATFFQKSDFEL